MVIKSMVIHSIFLNSDSYLLQLRNYFKFNHGEDHQNMTRIKQGAVESYGKFVVHQMSLRCLLEDGSETISQVLLGSWTVLLTDRGH